MKASVYYLLKNDGIIAFSKADVSAMTLLLDKIKKEGHDLKGIYITDMSCPYKRSCRKMICNDAKKGVFDLLYLYIFGVPTVINAKSLSDILDLPVNGGTSIFN